jgi:CRISPR system Cascade subunit CasB
MSTHTTAPTRRLDEVGRYVDRRVTALQSGVLAGAARAVAELARLRRGAGKRVEETPDLWSVTLAGVPLPEHPGDAPTLTEQAAHTALTLYAVHQQSQRHGMHRPGQGLGAAVRALSQRGPSAQAVRRRFEALGTAATFTEIVHHARGLITQLRGLAIPLDYGVLADQLIGLQRPGRADLVRLAWGRDFYHTPRDTSPTATDDTPSPQEKP